MPASLAEYSFPPGFERWITAKAKLKASQTVENYDFVKFAAGLIEAVASNEVLTAGYAVALEEATAGKTHISVLLPGGPIYVEIGGAIQPGGRFKLKNITAAGATFTDGVVVVAATAAEVAEGKSPGYVMRHDDDKNNLDAFAEGDIAIAMTEGA